MPDTPIFDALVKQYSGPHCSVKRDWLPPETEWALRAYWRGFGYYLTLKESCHG